MKRPCNNIDFAQKGNQKPLIEINLRLQCEKHFNTLIQERRTDIVNNIRENCLQFYVITAEEICKRLLINDKFLSKLKVFEANLTLFDSDRENSFNDVSFIAETFGGFDQNYEKNGLFYI